MKEGLIIMPRDRDALMKDAESLAQKMKYNYKGQERYVSHNELLKIMRYLIRHSHKPDPWNEVLKLLNQKVPRSARDWSHIKKILGGYKANSYSVDDLSLLLGWTARLLRYYSK
jgi:hypothetical protein